jgi:hypothetical protein
MYNKIASIILNSGKNPNYDGDVFVSQPDGNKEALAGKIFVLAEIEGRKAEAQKIINFLINSFEYNYYGDDNILLNDRTGELKIEKIFESVLSKINSTLWEFLQQEKLRLNPDNVNFTIGVIHENQIYFSNLGKNKAFLIFKKGEGFEILNIEANATDEEIKLEETTGAPAAFKIFSTVISGEIPLSSYFFFSNETIPEYLSNKELVTFITKLPPMVAAEQVKNSLLKMNSFVPFLGIIIKNTLGQAQMEIKSDNDADTLEQTDKTRLIHGTARESVHNLNYTEERTERMLAPAGIINFKKINLLIKGLLGAVNKTSNTVKPVDHLVKFHDNDEIEAEVETIQILSGVNNKKNIQPRRESFVIKEKITFKKKNFELFSKLGGVVQGIGVLFNGHFWVNLFRNIPAWFTSLNKKNKNLAVSFTAVLLILVISITMTVIHNRDQAAQQKFTSALNNADYQQNQVDSYLLYNNQTGAVAALNAATVSLAGAIPSNPTETAQKQALLDKIATQQNKINHLTKINDLQLIIDLRTINQTAVAKSMAAVGNRIFVTDANGQKIYDVAAKSTIDISSQAPLSLPAVSDNSLYYLSGQKIIKVDTKTKLVNTLTVGPENLGTGGNLIQIYNKALYLANLSDDQIYHYTQSGNAFTNRSAWIKDNSDIKSATDFTIDGSIYLALGNKGVIKLLRGASQSFDTSAITPAFRADRVYAGVNDLYSLDKTNNRIIITDKTGKLLNQYIINKGAIQDFAIDETNKAAYVLIGTQIYKFNLV